MYGNKKRGHGFRGKEVEPPVRAHTIKMPGTLQNRLELLAKDTMMEKCVSRLLFLWLLIVCSEVAAMHHAPGPHARSPLTSLQFAIALTERALCFTSMRGRIRL